MNDRATAANIIRRLVETAEAFNTHLSQHTDYWEGGGDTREPYYELINEAETFAKKLEEL